MQRRARIWPELLGVEYTHSSSTLFELHASLKHKDSSTVDVDVKRSIWSYTEGETSGPAGSSCTL